MMHPYLTVNEDTLLKSIFQEAQPIIIGISTIEGIKNAFNKVGK